MKKSGIQRKPTFSLRLEAKADISTFLLILERSEKSIPQTFLR